MTQIRRLTEKGIERFQAFIDSMPTDDPEMYDPQVVNDDSHSEVIASLSAFPDACPHVRRFDVARYLDEVIRELDLKEAAMDRGFWCWIAWVWFESLCPPGRDGHRKPGASGRWVLSLDYDRYYKHYLAGAWVVYDAHRDHPERALSLLCTDINKPGDLVETIVGRQELVSNRGLVEAVTKLYYDPETGKHKRGHASTRKNHAGKTVGKPGTARRLVEVVEQLEMIWDLYATTADEFLVLLPEEFDRFKPAEGTAVASADV